MGAGRAGSGKLEINVRTEPESSETGWRKAAPLFSPAAFLGALGYTLLFSLLVGYARFAVLGFLVGPQGMAAGALSGAMAGRLCGPGSAMTATLGRRVSFSGVLAGVYLLGQWLGGTVLLPDYDPVFFLRSLLDGDLKEMVIGTSRYSMTGIHEPVSVGWWVAFTLLDAMLFSFLGMALLNVFAAPDSTTGTRKGWPAHRMALIGIVVTSLIILAGRRTAEENRAAMAKWYHAAWASDTMLAVHLVQDGVFPHRRELRAELEAMLSEALARERPFPEGRAVQALMVLAGGDAAQARFQYRLALEEALENERWVRLSPVRRASPQALAANIRHCLAKLSLAEGAHAEAVAHLDEALKYYRSPEERERLKTLRRALEDPAMPALALGMLTELFPYQTAIFDQMGMPAAFGEAGCFYDRGLARRALGDPGASEDFQRAVDLGLSSRPGVP